MQSINTFLHSIPKVELHLHLVGSASAPVVAALAAKRPEAGVPTTVEELSDWYRFTNFEHFIEVYAKVASLVCSGEDIATLIESSARDLAAQNVRYVEMTITPFTHVQSGIAYDDVVEGLDAGRTAAKRLGVDFAWVYDIPGEMGQEAAKVTVDLAVNHPPDGLVGFGLGGIEFGVDRASFGWAFQQARAAGLASVPHAGEADGPASIRAALDVLGAVRIGHGVRAVEDKALLDRLVAEQVPLEVCTSSNVCTGVFPTLAHHSIGQLLEAGAFVTINTDDPPMFSTTLIDEYERISAAFDLGAEQLGQLAINGVNASFLDAETKTSMITEINAVVTKYT